MVNIFKTFIIFIIIVFFGIFYLSSMILKEKTILKLINNSLKTTGQRFMNTIPYIQEILNFYITHDDVVKFNVTGNSDFMCELNSILSNNKNEIDIKNKIIVLINKYDNKV